MTFDAQKLLNVMKFNLPVFSPHFVACGFGVIVRNPLPRIQGHEDLFLCFLLRDFLVLALIFRWLTHFKLIFVYRVR